MLFVLILGLAVLVSVFRVGPARTLLTIVLPAILFLPGAFHARIPHLPPMTFHDAALASLGVGILFKELPRWRFSFSDLWVFIFIATAGYAEKITWGASGAWLRFISGIFECYVPYMAGKLLVEQPGIRLKFAQYFVPIMAVTCLLAIPQFFLKNNLFIYFWSHFFPGQWFVSQTRMGFGRVNGPYGNTETAGMTMLIGLLLAVWLQHAKLLLPSRFAKLFILILFVALLMTQSRGPWIGAVLAFTVAFIGRTPNAGRRAMFVISIGVLVAIPLYTAFNSYTSGKRDKYGSLRETSQYRREMIQNFVPIAKEGGAWGWGNSFPHPNGQTSIDNAYLLIWLLQGYVGLGAFLLLYLGTIIRFIFLAIRAQSVRERYFVLTLLGIVLGLALSLGTVYLSDQTYLLLFLLFGWSEGIVPGQAAIPDSASETSARQNVLEDSILIYT